MANRPDGAASSEAATSYPRLDPQPSTVVTSPSPTAAVSSVRDLREPPISATTARPEHESASMMEVDRNSASDDRSQRAASVLSMDDIEAAQALEGLRSGKDEADLAVAACLQNENPVSLIATRTDFGQSPRSSRPAQQESPAGPPTTETPQSEPLLSLLTSTHPLVSSAINRSVSAYTTSKSYSPRFRCGAEFIERNIGSPVVNTVGSVGRKTGVEGGLRWALQRRESTATDNDRNKRRKMSGGAHPDEMEIEKGVEESEQQTRSRRSSDLSSAEPLPPYDDNKSPKYEEVTQSDEKGDEKRQSEERMSRQAWANRLVISTSGLGVAMSEESLRSLQYCLTWLKWANGRLGNAVLALRNLLKQWEEYQATGHAGANGSEDQAQLAQRIQALKEDVLATLKQVVDIVSKYAGGALPENARNLVRKHLTSLPQRFRIAFTSNPQPGSSSSSSDATINAHRVLVLAQEGLDMMAQVSGVVNDTLVSAETWCERLGRKRPARPSTEELEQSPRSNEPFPMDVKVPLHVETEQDHEMSGMDTHA
ncbi:transcriptional regulator opi1 [Paecilomyces lecythidis]|uniref:Transcriptional regulator opi1 n=1 Tax=Paecilomyces lecythidis TaxID=3004212 RepID=A0ABR3WTN2_9EURO